MQAPQPFQPDHLSTAPVTFIENNLEDVVGRKRDEIRLCSDRDDEDRLDIYPDRI